MRLELRLSTYAAVFLWLIAVALGLDPLYLIFKTTTVTISRIGLLLFRVTVMYIVVNELIKAVDAYFVAGLMFVCSMNDFIGEIGQSRKPSNALDLQKIQLYRQLQIWNGCVNRDFCYLAVPPLIFFGVSFIILTIYGTIRLAGKISWVLYPIIPTSCGMACFFLAIIPLAANVFEDSASYLKETGKGLSKKDERKVVRSLRPLAIEIGPFGRLDKALLPEVIKTIIDNTANLLVTF